MMHEDIQYVREQLLDCRTGKLVWRSVESLEADYQVRDGELMKLPAPRQVSGYVVRIPYEHPDDRRRLMIAAEPPLDVSVKTVGLKQARMIVGPYMVRIWELADGDEKCQCLWRGKIQSAGCPVHG